LLQNILGFSSGKGLSLSGEMYGLQHTVYNLKPLPQTYWFNMGLWDGSNQTFADACRNLVHKVMSELGGHAQVDNSRLLDVGYGCADSCFLLAEDYGCNVSGVTIEQSQYELAKDRLQKNYAHLQPRVHLLKGSAAELPTLFGADQKFDIIVAIDCAYHFNTRWSFMASGLNVLADHGQIGLFDVAIQPNALEQPYKRWLFEKICSAGDVPPQNMVDADQYEAKLREIGYTDIHITRIDVDRVYGGLARFLKQHAEAWSNAGLEPTFGNYNRLVTVAHFLELLCWGKWIEPVIVTGKKRSVGQP